MEEDVSLHVSAVTSSWPLSDERLELIRQGTKEDINLAMSLQYTANSWPVYKEDVKLAVRDLFAVRNKLSTWTVCVVARHWVGHQGMSCLLPTLHRKETIAD